MLSDVRMICGNTTIKKIKEFSTKERCIDIAFSDRYSLSVFDTKSLNKLNKRDLVKLANKFYNDTYLMDQNACRTSLIIWLGNGENSQLMNFGIYFEVVNQKLFDFYKTSNKYYELNKLCLSSKNIKNIIKLDIYIFRIVLKSLLQIFI